MKNNFLAIIILFMTNFVFAQVGTSNKVTCSEKQQKTQGNSEPKLIKTCTWSKYKCVSIGEADEKGRYYYSYQWYTLTSGQYVKIDKSQLFNENTHELIERINEEISNYFFELYADSENEECLSMVEELPYYDISNLDVFMEIDGFTLSYSFGLPDACLAIDGDFISFTFEEIQPFLN